MFYCVCVLIFFLFFFFVLLFSLFSFFSVCKRTNAVVNLCFSVGSAWLQHALSTFESTHPTVHLRTQHGVSYKMSGTVFTLSGLPKPAQETGPPTSKRNTRQTKLRALTDNYPFHLFIPVQFTKKSQVRYPI